LIPGVLDLIQDERGLKVSLAMDKLIELYYCADSYGLEGMVRHRLKVGKPIT
jgi:hypothetical protein